MSTRGNQMTWFAWDCPSLPLVSRHPTQLEYEREWQRRHIASRVREKGKWVNTIMVSLCPHIALSRLFR